MVIDWLWQSFNLTMIHTGLGVERSYWVCSNREPSYWLFQTEAHGELNTLQQIWLYIIPGSRPFAKELYFMVMCRV